jgi:hypothetical protein
MKTEKKARTEDTIVLVVVVVLVVGCFFNSSQLARIKVKEFLSISPLPQ